MVKRDEHIVKKIHAQSMAQSVQSGQGLDSKLARELVIDLRVELAKKLGHFPSVFSDDKVLLIMHKFRYEMPDCPEGKRHDSRRWLEERGLHRFRMKPWPPEGELP